MFSRKLFYVLLILFFVSVSCNQSQTNSKQINFSGAYALYPLAIKWSQEFQKKNSALRFNIQPGGAGKGLTDILSNNADVGMFSREITNNESHKHIWYIAVAKDAVFPTINTNNPYHDTLLKRGLTKDQLKSLFVDGKPNTWEALLGIKNNAKNKIDLYSRSDASGAAESWAGFFNTHQDNLKGIAMLGDPGIAHAVKKDANGIGFNNTQYIYDIETGAKINGMEILPFDVNNNGVIDSNENFYANLNSVTSAVLNGNYPSPPVRGLYFVCKQKPTNPDLLNFFKWILTTGQQYIKSSGYIPLPDDVLKEQLKKLE